VEKFPIRTPNRNAISINRVLIDFFKRSLLPVQVRAMVLRLLARAGRRDG
jgi:hypothetical protein